MDRQTQGLGRNSFAARDILCGQIASVAKIPVIDEEEAKIVRLIYRLYLDGKSTVAICKEFNEKGISTPSGKGKWSISTVNSILTNEKYKGDALLQKQFTVDFLTKKTKVNEGELPQYYVEGSHPAIIVR